MEDYLQGNCNIDF